MLRSIMKYFAYNENVFIIYIEIKAKQLYYINVKVKGVKNMFINFTNHPSNNWGVIQIKESLKYGKIIDLPFPEVSLVCRWFMCVFTV